MSIKRCQQILFTRILNCAHLNDSFLTLCSLKIRYREVKRTQGVSTTDLVGRMLLCTKSHHVSEEQLPNQEQCGEMGSSSKGDIVSPWTKSCQFLATTKKIIQFSNGRDPKVLLILLIYFTHRPFFLFIKMYLSQMTVLYTQLVHLICFILDS